MLHNRVPYTRQQTFNGGAHNTTRDCCGPAIRNAFTSRHSSPGSTPLATTSLQHEIAGNSSRPRKLPRYTSNRRVAKGTPASNSTRAAQPRTVHEAADVQRQCPQHNEVDTGTNKTICLAASRPPRNCQTQVHDDQQQSALHELHRVTPSRAPSAEQSTSHTKSSPY